jgi:thiosulfate/3-mercaptopyruvate sulfurtransferase
MMQSLVTTQWLADHLGQPDLAIIDSSFFLPDLGRDAKAEFQQAHIPGARFLDITKIADKANPAPHMLPTFSGFAEAMTRLGVSWADRIVVYDNSPHRTAARGWFMLRHFGAKKVAILDGGFQKWRAEDKPTEQGPKQPRSATWFHYPERGDVLTKDKLIQGIALPILDARSAARFEGTEPEPRPGLASGHIPDARNLPMPQLYNEDGTFKSPDELRALFVDAGVDPGRPFVASCGSGVTACSLIFAAHLLGHDSGLLYDGSWSEWGADPSTPKAVGPALKE